MRISISAPQSIGTPRSNPRYYDEKLRVAVNVDDLRGHKVIRAGRFILSGKKFAPDGKTILCFENHAPAFGDGWDGVSRNGVIRIIVDYSRARAYVEGSGYTLYLYKW